MSVNVAGVAENQTAHSAWPTRYRLEILYYTLLRIHRTRRHRLLAITAGLLEGKRH